MPPLGTSWFGVIATTVCLSVASYIHWYNSRLKSVNYMPGMRVLFSPITIFGAALPLTWWNPGMKWTWYWRKTGYMNRQRDMISVVPFLAGRPFYYTGSLHVTKQILLNDFKIQMEKPKSLGSALLLWGDNLITANGEMWKRHRRLLNPAFSRETYIMVIEETAALYRELVSAEGWSTQTDLTFDHFNRIPQKLAYLVVARCGFDVRTPWAEEEANPDDPDTSLGDTLKIVCESVIARLLLPMWAYRLPIKSLHFIDSKWKSLEVQMNEFVLRRKEELDVETLDGGKQRKDLFSRLVGALDHEAKVGLSMQEVIGNTFTFMFAGHETTAHVMSATLAFLAIHPEEQEKAVDEIRQNIPADKDPTLDDLAKLTHTLACFVETLRIYPAGVILSRDILEDITVEVEYPRKETVAIPKGSLVIIDMVGVHHDPHVFPEPEKFNPSRWYGASDHDMTMFGAGPRACIGRKFSQLEALTFFSLLLRDWKVDVLLQPNETRAQYAERVMEKASMIGLAFGVESVPLKLTKRA
ncbi:hypothetical protein QCA50_008810 [Cerrena zonata]|uniref:Cytochrome P450 n=1 Tax=Cerrena zonata TaxID=2478898 RepID=A0AAW0G408_9APHY